MPEIINCEFCGKPRPGIVSSCPYCKPSKQQLLNSRINKTAETVAKNIEDRKAAQEQKEHLLNTSTIKCKKCAMDVPAKAEICPFCRTRIKTSMVTKTIAIILVVLFFVGAITQCFFSESSQQAPKPNQSARAYVTCDGKNDRVVNYSVLLGRAVACGEDITEPMRYVGGWLDSCFSESERSTQLLVFTAGVEYQAKQQKEGKGPDSCGNVTQVFRSTTWPDNK